MKGRLQSVVALSLTFFACAGPALACTCIFPGIESHALVFRGKVESVDAGSARFKVKAVYRGEIAGDSIEIKFSNDMCFGTSFTDGATDTVFAYLAGGSADKPQFFTTGCSMYAPRASPLVFQAALDAYRIEVADARSAVERSPGSEQAWLALAKIQESHHDYLPAIRTFEKLRELAPKTASYSTRQGDAYAGLHFHEQALAAYDRALALDRDDAQAKRGRDQVLANLQRSSR